MAESSPDAHSGLHFSRIFTEAGTVFGARVLGTGLSYIVQVLFARWAGPEHYGAYSYAMAWTALLSTFSGVGFPQAIVRFIPEYETGHQWGALRGVVRRSEQVVVGVSCALAVGGIGFVLGLSSLRGVALYTVPLVLSFALVPPRALLRLQTRMCVARRQMQVAHVLPQLLRPAAMLAGAAVLVLSFRQPLTATAAVLIAGAPVIPVWLTQRWAFRAYLPDTLNQAPRQYESRHWLRTALPMFLITGFFLLLGKTDLLMIGLLGEPTDVGLYRVASKTASLVLFPLYAINTVITPRFSEQYTRDNHEQLQRLASTAAQWMFAGALSVSFGLVATADLILGLFGPSFLEAKVVMMILIGSQVLNAGAGSVGPLLTMTGHQNESALIFGISALLNVGLNAIGISLFGIYGAAIATATSTLVWNLALYHVVVKKLDVYPSILDVFWHLPYSPGKP